MDERSSRSTSTYLNLTLLGGVFLCGKFID
jgi:hypothetical protein